MHFSNYFKELDNGGFEYKILRDWSKAYDYIPHELFIAKSKCYGIENRNLQLLLQYLANGKQKMKIGSYFSLWCYINTVVSQVSILGPLLFSQKSVILRMIIHYAVAVKI